MITVPLLHIVFILLGIFLGYYLSIRALLGITLVMGLGLLWMLWGWQWGSLADAIPLVAIFIIAFTQVPMWLTAFFVRNEHLLDNIKTSLFRK